MSIRFPHHILIEFRNVQTLNHRKASQLIECLVASTEPTRKRVRLKLLLWTIRAFSCRCQFGTRESTRQRRWSSLKLIDVKLKFF